MSEQAEFAKTAAQPDKRALNRCTDAERREQYARLAQWLEGQRASGVHPTVGAAGREFPRLSYVTICAWWEWHDEQTLWRPRRHPESSTERSEA